MKNLDNLSKEEIVRMINDGVIYHDRHGLLKLVQEWIEKSEIKLVSIEHTLVVRAIEAVKSLENYDISIERNIDFDLQLVKTIQPIAFEIVRNHFVIWVEKNKSPSLSAWVKTVSMTLMGTTFRRAGCEKKRFNDGYRYLMKIPGLVTVRKKRNQCKTSPHYTG